MKEEVLQIKTMGEKISTLFINAYEKHLLLVNRRYQRKLVWSIEEKQAFIDTLLHGYPVPLFLFAKTGEDKKREIIDGLQRLDAIFSFIKQEFSVKWGEEQKEYYCNLQEIIFNKEKIKAKEPMLDRELCREFFNYELPTTTTEVEDINTINEIFKRLNSTGRKLAKQDLRQAGVVSDFSDLVRNTATEIRGDVTFGDSIDVFEMPRISISNERLDYGVDIKEMFWVKHDIITKAEIRKSKDEETLAQIYGYMILGKECNVNSETLDSFYDVTSNNYSNIENTIQSDGSDIWFHSFFEIFEELQKILNVAESTFTDLLFTKRATRGKSKIFIALLLAIWELKKENKVIGDPSKASHVLNGICGHDSLTAITKNNSWSKKIRDNAVKYFKEKLKAVTIKQTQNCVKNIELQAEVSNVLKSSSSETQTVDFKLGIMDLNHGSLNKNAIQKMVKTLTAMANTDCTKNVYIIIGIADNEKSAKDFENHYGVHHTTNDKRCYVGIEAEVERYFNNTPDNYENTIKNVIENCPIEDSVKNDILCNSGTIVYCNRSLMILKYKNPGKVVKYGGKAYVRHFSNNSFLVDETEAYDDLVIKIHEQTKNQ